MTQSNRTARFVLTACAFALTSVTGLATAQNALGNAAPLRTPPDAEPYFPSANQANEGQARTASPEAVIVAPAVIVPEERTAPRAATGGAVQEDARDAAEQVAEAATVVQQMERDGNLRAVLEQAQGIFIVPDYGRAAFGVGARGGEGVLLVKNGERWSDPLFYNMGGISGGIQAGAEAGSIAMILNNQRAVNSFMQNNNWSLNADAGLTVVAWSAKGQASVGKGDVIVWSDTEGLFGDLAISVTDINFDEDETAAFYGGRTTLAQILNGAVQSPPQVVSVLKQALPGSMQAGVGSSMPGEAVGGTTGSGMGERPAVN